GGLEQATSGNFNLIYNATATKDSNRALWVIKEESADKYSIKNVETNQYIKYEPSSYDSRYIVMSNQLDGNSTLFTVNNQSGSIFAIASVADPEQFFNIRSGTYGVGTYKGTYSANELFYFQSIDGTIINGDDIHIGGGRLSEYLNSFTLNGRDLIECTSSKKLYYPLKVDQLYSNVTLTVDFDLKKTDYTIKINGKNVVAGEDITISNVESNKDYSLQILENGTVKTTEYIIFTGLPIVQLYSTSLSSTFAKAKIRVTEPDKEAASTGELLNAQLRYRGASAQGYNKKAFAIKLRDENDLASIDRSFFGLREDNYWILDAMALDKSRMRNRISTDLWNDFSTPPHYYDKEPKLINGTRGQYVEVFLDDEYWGLYCMTERIDRKQLKLKKYNEETETIRGVLYKSSQWSYSVMFGWSYLGSTIPDYDNNRETWANFEVKYPELDDAEPIDWEPLYDAVTFSAKSDDITFADGASSNFDLPVWADYFLLMELILATDNHGKNGYYYMYNIAQEKKLSIAPWDMDGVFGIRWDGSTYITSPSQDYRTFTTQHEHGQNYFLYRMIEKNVSGFKDLLKSRYDKLRLSYFSVESLTKRFTDYMELFDVSGAAEREIDRWDGANRIYLDFESEMAYAINWIEERVSYLDQQYGPPLTEPIAVTGVSLNHTSLSMLPGNTIQLAATITPADADNKLVTWSSSNKSIATVSTSGLVTAVGEGTATITVTTNDGGHKATCVFTVISDDTPVTGVTLNRSTLSIYTNEEFQLTATVNPNDATDKAVSWTSSNTDVATVSASGLVKAVEEGTATITVTTHDGNHKATCVCTVVKPSGLGDVDDTATLTIKNNILFVGNADVVN
ncbi:CotH kinase family protein, partial [Bacteroidales bacterium OttesenSCG-928-M11]|nr:CotH kinase family protein [Bacteroidales bacterium OttesenSCG-928-M11]